MAAPNEEVPGTPGAPALPALPALPDGFTGMELADAVEAVRQGLLTGAVRGAGSAVRFEVGEIHMEFTVELQRVRTGHGGVKAWVVEAGGESTRTLGRTHTVSFTLRPKDAATGRYLEIGPPGADDPPSLSYE